jgi:hypothetical protein
MTTAFWIALYLAVSFASGLFAGKLIKGRIGKRSPKLSPQEEEHVLLAALNNNLCPDCGGFGTMLLGPRGGASTNVKCEACGSEFNVCLPWFAERISRRLGENIA